MQLDPCSIGSIITSIMTLFTKFLQETWWLTAEMAPFLLLGFVIAGLLRVFFNEDWVKRHLGQKGFKQIFKAVIIGIPLPLCSCGVIPVAAGIRRQGGQRGAVAAFTASTPQTGVDSIVATVGMLGWVFAGARIFIAFINGIVAGLVVEKWGDKDEESLPASEETGECCCSSESTRPVVEESCCASESAGPVAEESCCSSEATSPNTEDSKHSLASGLKFGLLTLPKDLFWALVIGLLIAGAVSSLVPAEFFADLPGGRFGLYIAMTLISLPLYVCSTGSIPLAFSFLQAGMSPGAVLIFLIAGPASNSATVLSLWKIIGGRGTIGYILSIVVTSWVVAILMDFSGISIFVTEAIHHHDMGVNLFQQVMGGLLIILLLVSKLRK